MNRRYKASLKSEYSWQVKGMPKTIKTFVDAENPDEADSKLMKFLYRNLGTTDYKVSSLVEV